MSSIASKQTGNRGAVLAMLFVSASCATEEVGSAGYFELAHIATLRQNAQFTLMVAPDANSWADLDGYYVNRPEYTLKVDGRWAARMEGATPVQIDPIHTHYGPGGFVPAGAHVIELVDQNGDSALATPPLVIEADRLNTLVVFGNRDALEHALIATSLDTQTGMNRHTFVNLVRTGYALDVFRCDGDTPDTCITAVAGPLAYRESIQIDFPRQITEPRAGWRVVPTDLPGATLGVFSSIYWMVVSDPAAWSPSYPTGAPQIQFVAPFLVDPGT